MEEHIVRRLSAAADTAGRPAPRAVAGIPVALTHDADAAREKTNAELAIDGQLPSYRGMLDRGGAAGPADVAILSDENAFRGQLDRYRNAGVTDLNAVVMQVDEGSYERTVDFLAEML